ncbi:MAG: amidase [Actinomycetota bacterium]|nr:amidase [Actinomycetota bacterium]
MRDFSATEIARATVAGELDSLELVEGTLAALEEQAGLNAVITVCADEAVARARERPSGRLAGVPVLVKDLFDTAGVRTTYGSRIYRDHVPDRTASSVAALEAAGAIVVGKANLDEFAWGVTGHNAHWGDCQNPRLPGRVSGGSSSGNGAALAAGLVPLALGSDTGGSVRMPSACCATVGLKTSLGKISTDAVFPLCPSFDTVGPMARSVTDCALAYSVLTGDPVPAPGVAGLTVGVLTRPPPVGAPGVEPPSADERAFPFAEQLEALGARVVETEVRGPGVDTWPMFLAEAAESHRETFPWRRDDYGDSIRAKLDSTRGVRPEDARASREGVLAWRRMEPDVDLFVSPTLGVREIPPIEASELEVRITFSMWTRPFNYLGWAAIALGELQLIAPRDETVLAAALAWEEAYGSAG